MLKIEESQVTRECSICSAEFLIYEENGLEGYFGIMPVAFCEDCLVSMVDMVEQRYPCQKCMKRAEEAEPQ